MIKDSRINKYGRWVHFKSESRRDTKLRLREEVFTFLETFIDLILDKIRVENKARLLEHLNSVLLIYYGYRLSIKNREIL